MEQLGRIGIFFHRLFWTANKEVSIQVFLLSLAKRRWYRTFPNVGRMSFSCPCSITMVKYMMNAKIKAGNNPSLQPNQRGSGQRKSRRWPMISSKIFSTLQHTMLPSCFLLLILISSKANHNDVVYFWKGWLWI